MVAWEGINRRRFPRAEYACTVRIRRKGQADTFNTHTENIGCGGICVILPKDAKIFSPVEVNLDLADNDPKIKCDGTIVWVIRSSEIDKGGPNVYDTGIEFANLTTEDRERVEKIITKCLQKNKS
jgi:hypothetical protein